jgi:hypothetical protein
MVGVDRDMAAFQVGADGAEGVDDREHVLVVDGVVAFNHGPHRP